MEVLVWEPVEDGPVSCMVEATIFRRVRIFTVGIREGRWEGWVATKGSNIPPVRMSEGATKSEVMKKVENYIRSVQNA